MKHGKTPLASDPSYCKGCLEKQQRIDRLTAENERLRSKLKRQERTAKEAPFGASTPSSKKLVKASSLEENRAKKGGARLGHEGHGRRSACEDDADRIETLEVPEVCPDCGGVLEDRGERERTIHDCEPVKKVTRLVRIPSRHCACCGKTFRGKSPDVLPKSCISNRLLAQIVKWHYVDGLTLGNVSRQFGVGIGTLVERLHALAGLFGSADEALVREYRAAPVKHADETGWRGDGANGYTWGFFTPTTSIFRCRSTRAAKVAEEIFGDPADHTGTLVVDRYAAYNVFMSFIQYCLEHLKRDTLKVGENNPEVKECQVFADALAPLLIEAMKLRTQTPDPVRYREAAEKLRIKIEAVVARPAKHPSVQHVQNIFREHRDRIYQWTQSPDIPAENNRAERGLRPLVIARKISFGSQSDKGLKTREILMSIANTLALRVRDPVEAIKQTLDALVADPKLDVAAYLFGKAGIARA
jgi:hypothetical protein